MKYLLHFFAFFILFASTTRGAEPDWQPKKTWVFAIGVLEWQAKDLFASFPQKDRRDAELIAFFKKQGVPDEQIVFLVDKEATKKGVEAALAPFLAKSRAGDLLVFYYAGHGVQPGAPNQPHCLANYDMTSPATGLTVPALIDTIDKNFRGSRVLLTADCCHSGALGVEAGRRKGRIAYASLTSVHPAGTSTGNWTFTETLLRGLRGDGAIDADRDGKITLAELSHFTEEELAFVEGQLAHFTVSAAFTGDTTLSLVDKAIGAEKPGDVAVKDRFVEVEWKGDWWRAKVQRVKGDESFIRYAGFGPEWDEWVPPSRVRPYKPATLPLKSAVQVEWGGKLWKATVIGNKLGLHYVHYDGFGPEWDEWVSPKRVRR